MGEIYFGLSKAGLEESTYIKAQVAIAFHNMRQVDQAVTYFKQLGELDPYRLDNLDTYSNLLYVKEQRVELAHLAHRTNMIDKYRTETCCVIGNYYSLRSQHEKAVVYFQRALKLNPGYLSALTLMGHEYMEMKNTHAAIQSYRQAIEVNRTNDTDQAAAAYNQYIIETEAQGITDRDEQSGAYKYLASYYLKQEMLNEAYDFAMKCTEFADVREEAKALLKEIASRRGVGGEGGEGMSVLGEDTQNSVIASRLRPHLAMNSPGGGTLSPRRDLEPVNLNFTP